MDKHLLNYKGLFGDDFDLLEGSLIHHEPIETRSLLYDFEIKQHLHSDLYQVFLITSGGGLLLSSGVKIPLDSPCALTIPSNRLHGFAFQTEVRGEVFTIHESLIEKIITSTPIICSPFDQLQYIPLEAGADSFIELLQLKEKIISELQKTDNASKISVVLLFQLFLLNLYRLRREDHERTITSTNRVLNHFNNFKKLIKKHGFEGKTVNFYANELNLTPVHLNRICKSATQKSALEIIHEQLLKEAKKYLSGTTNTIAEIAYFLGFKDPAHFSKFFKKKEGTPPGKFRKEDRQIQDRDIQFDAD